METDPRQDFLARCQRAAAVVRDAGVALSKAPREHAIVLTRNGASVSFPIVTDDRVWRETTPEEALYAAVADAFAWASANVSDTSFATLDALEHMAVPKIKSDYDGEIQKVHALAEIMGGMDVVRKLWEAAGIDADAAASVQLG